ncbi:MAG: N-acetylmuramoyl-L-alanine amidase, partial [Chloroflexi bacterium]|nr:N-acetylmuramoyl-L-alanine amidase [Chloroflexota bacterium]
PALARPVPPPLSVAPAPNRNALTVVLDPGHGGDEPGASAHGLVERDTNLAIALLLEPMLQARGFRVVLTRRDAGRALPPSEVVATGFTATRSDLQARIDLANHERAAAFVSIHSNGSADPSARGVEAYYNSGRPFADLNHALAASLYEGALAELAASGYPATGRGVRDDACLRLWRGTCFPLFVLAPERVTTREEVLRRGVDPATAGFALGQDAISSRATAMPGALVELLFISNPADAAILADPRGQDALARGLAAGIERYLAWAPAP